MRRLLAVAVLALAVAGTAAAAPSAPPNDQYLARQWYLGRDHALDTFGACEAALHGARGGDRLGRRPRPPRAEEPRSSPIAASSAGPLTTRRATARSSRARSRRSRTTRPGSPASRRRRACSWRRSSATTARSRRAPRRARSAGRSDQGARVINLSLGSTRDPSDPSVDGFSRASSARSSTPSGNGALVVAAVGNGDDAPAKPWPCASYPAALPARARGRRLRTPGRRAELLEPRRPLRRHGRARDGHVLALPAPADLGVPGCVEQGYSSCGTKDYRHADGTSFSSPQVAAAAALLFGEEAALRPDQVSTILEAERRRRDARQRLRRLQPGAGPAQRLRPARRRRRARRATGTGTRTPTGSSRTTTPAPRPRSSTTACRRPRRSTGGTTRTTSTGSISRGASGSPWWCTPARSSTRRSCSGSRGSTRSPTRAPTCARALDPRPGVPERIRFKAPRSAWYYLQVKLARPGFGPYRIHLAF